MNSLTPKTVFYDNGDRFVGNYRSDTNKAEGHGEFVYAAGGEYKGAREKGSLTFGALVELCLNMRR